MGITVQPAPLRARSTGPNSLALADEQHCDNDKAESTHICSYRLVIGSIQTQPEPAAC